MDHFQDIQEETNIFAILKENLKETYEYIMVKNWLDAPNQRILKLASSCQKIKQLENMLGDEARIFLQGYTLALMSTAILDFASE